MDLNKKDKSEDSKLIFNREYNSSNPVYDLSVGANVVIDEKGKIIIANENFFSAIKKPYNCLGAGLPAKDLFSENDRERLSFFYHERIKDPYNSPKTSVFEITDSCGDKHDTTITAVRIPGTKRIFLSGIDRTNFKQNEYSYSPESGFFSDIITESLFYGEGFLLSDGSIPGQRKESIIITIGGRVAYANKPACRLFNLQEIGELIGTRFFDHVHKKSEKKFEELLINGELRKSVFFETELYLKNGKKLFVDLSVYPVSIKGLSGIQYVISDISEKKFREIEALSEKRQLEIINAILSNMISSFSLGDMLTNLLDLTLNELNFDLGIIYLKCEDGMKAEISSVSGIPMHFVEKNKTIDIRSWPNNLIFYAGQPKFVENLPESHISHPDIIFLEDIGAISYAALPLESDGTIIGAIYVAKEFEGSFTSFEKNTLQLISKEVGSLILHGLLQERLEKECSEEKQCLRIILDDISELNEEIFNSISGTGISATFVSDNRGVLCDKIIHTREIIHNLQVIDEKNSGYQNDLKPVCVDTSVHSSIFRYPNVEIKYENCGYFVYADDYLQEIFSNIIGYSLRKGGRNIRIAISSEVCEDMVKIYLDVIGFNLLNEEKTLFFGDFEEDNPELNSDNISQYVVFLLVNRYGGEINVLDRISADSFDGILFEIKLHSCRIN
ncbi:GAF domain-containing protein [Methanochimaera problematica]|nr:PAS domain-containing protein [Methanoplanus sp. FWC-SCC4]